MDNEQKKPGQDQPRPEDDATPKKATTTHNLDTGEDEPLEPGNDSDKDDDESIMDFGSGSGGGSAGDGGAA